MAQQRSRSVPTAFLQVAKGAVWFLAASGLVLPEAGNQTALLLQREGKKGPWKRAHQVCREMPRSNSHQKPLCGALALYPHFLPLLSLLQAARMNCSGEIQDGEGPIGHNRALLAGGQCHSLLPPSSSSFRRLSNASFLHLGRKCFWLLMQTSPAVIYLRH